MSLEKFSFIFRKKICRSNNDCCSLIATGGSKKKSLFWHDNKFILLCIRYRYVEKKRPLAVAGHIVDNNLRIKVDRMR
jgi:hypothetical protein